MSFPFEITEEIVEEIFEGKPKYSIKMITSEPKNRISKWIICPIWYGRDNIIEAFKTPMKEN